MPASRHRAPALLPAALLIAVSLLGAAPAPAAAEDPTPTPAPGGASRQGGPTPDSGPIGPRLFQAGAAASLASDPDPLPSGFWDRQVIGGLSEPTAVEFAADGRVFITEKRGVIKVFSSLSDRTPTVFADLSDRVYNYWDRGLLGMALAPGFPADPWVYALYSDNTPLGEAGPDPGLETGYADSCPDPPGSLRDGCRGSARLVKMRAAGDVMTGSPVELIHDWCQQFPWHSIGTVAFGPDGALYVGAGDAAVASTDYGQYGGSPGSPTPRNPCGDPPSGEGGTQDLPSAEGGSLRAQDLRTSSDATTLDGAIIRIDPQTGAAAPGNPLAASSDPNARRIVAYGLRNPFRFTFRPDAPSPELWIGDVGQAGWEEIDRLVDPAGRPTPANFGWPCYEGLGRPAGALDVTLCQQLDAAVASNPATIERPYFHYSRSGPIASTDQCSPDGASLAGVAFYDGGAYPNEYDGALFFADYSRMCITALLPGTDGLPSGSRARTMLKDAAGPVELTRGPAGDIFYIAFGDFGGSNGGLRRISYQPTDPPTAIINASPPSGAVPLTVSFDSTGSSDPEGGALSYEWDLDGDSAFDDGRGATASETYRQPGIHPARLRVTDPPGATDLAETTVSVGTSGHTLTYLSDLTWSSASNGHGPVERDMSVGESGAGDGGPLRLDGLEYEKGLGVHPFASAPAEIVYSISGCSRFQSDVGVDDESGLNGSVVFEVWVDGALRHRSATLTGTSATARLSIDLTRASQLRLVVTNSGDHTHSDHADWAGARVFCAGPVAEILTPTESERWSANESIDFYGQARAADGTAIPAADLEWTIVLYHCTLQGACHAHSLAALSGAASGTFTAPDHEYPSYIEIRLRATDANGAVGRVTQRLDPETATLSFATIPVGLQLTVGSGSGTAPFQRTVVVGSRTTITAPARQATGGTTYGFLSWSDTGARSHDVTASATGATFTARYAPDAAPDTCVAATTSPSGTWLRDPLTVSDEDWYRFSHPGGNARIVLGRFSAPAALELYAECGGALLARSDRSGVIFEELLRSLPAGTYRVRVTGDVQPAPYALRFTSFPARLQLLSSRSWVSGGTLHIVGEVFNGAAVRMGDLRVEATLYDGSGASLGSAARQPFLDILGPRGRTAFHLKTPAPAGFARAGVRLRGAATSRSIVRGLSSVLSSVTTEGGARHYRGSITNGGTITVRDPEAFITLYDSIGSVQNTSADLATPTVLGPGATASFDVVFAERWETPNLSARQVQAQAP